jgi:hypothetical protein
VDWKETARRKQQRAKHEIPIEVKPVSIIIRESEEDANADAGSTDLQLHHTKMVNGRIREDFLPKAHAGQFRPTLNCKQ